jgi:hypothetical protein
LLRALEGGGTYAIADPVAEGTVIVRQESAGVSLGGGRFPISAADELVRRDLVEPSGAGAGRRFCISRVGVARRRRQAAPPDLAFPAQHQDLIRARIAFEGRSAAVTLDASESPLDWLRRRKDASGAPLIDEACHQAGERLRLDLTLAAMLPRVTANWDAAYPTRPAALRAIRRRRPTARSRRGSASSGRSRRWVRISPISSSISAAS